MMFVRLLLLVLVTLCHGEVGEDTPLSPRDQDWINSLFYLPDTPRIRKEYRMLTQGERDLFNGAFLKLKQDTTVSPNKYDLLVSLHARRASRNSAHRGPGFHAWHRVFTLIMENALREKEPSVTMAYWDSTIDSRLALPRDACLWTEDFMGNGDGFVKVGPFKDWSTQLDKLYRTVGIIEGPLTDRNISRLFRFTHVANISYPNNDLKDSEDILELTHNRVHRWIGGEMKAIETAADDPFFFIYHSFTNLIWEIFRGHQRSNGVDPENDWDRFYGVSRHHKFAPMGLGQLMAIDGSNDIFAENIIYARRPFCSRIDPDCGSPYLYCNLTIEKCTTWTIKEYKWIKEKAMSENIKFEMEAEEQIERKLSGVVELFVGEGHGHGGDSHGFEGHVTEADHDHSHELNGDIDSHEDGSHEVGFHEDDSHEDDSHEDGSHEDDSHEHNAHTHTHSNIHNTLGELHFYSLKHVGTFIQKNLQMVLLAGTLLVLIILSIISKCLEEGRREGTSKRKYRMDGIINVNYSGSERIKEERNKDNRNEPRPDNIYTITITSNNASPGTPGTFVRFAKYEIQQDRQTSGTSTPSSTVVNTSKGDYLDMDYATRIMNEAKSCDSDLYEISLASNGEEEDEHCVSDFELESTYNSIENENFAPICLHASSESCDQMCFDNATKSIDDVLADYDNLVFRPEPPTDPHLDCLGSAVVEA